VIEVLEDGVKQLKARSVEPESELNKRCTIEKLEIERVYWYEKGIDWGIVTEHEIPMVLTENPRDPPGTLVVSCAQHTRHNV